MQIKIINYKSCLVDTARLANMPQGEGSITKGQGLPMNMRLEKSMDQGRRLNHWWHAICRGHRDRLDRGRLEQVEYGENGWLQVQHSEMRWQDQSRRVVGWERRNLKNQEGAQGADRLPLQRGNAKVACRHQAIRVDAVLEAFCQAGH